MGIGGGAAMDKKKATIGIDVSYLLKGRWTVWRPRERLNRVYEAEKDKKQGEMNV